MLNTKNLFKKKEVKTAKTYSMQFRFLATVIGAMLAITIVIGGISIYEVDNYIQSQAENYVSATCQSEGTQINGSFSDMEKSVKIMESYLMDFFACEADISDRNVQQKVIESADAMFAEVAKHTSGAIAYYFRFDPFISDTQMGLFYSKLNGSDEYTSLPPTDISLYEKDDTEHVGWFWQPYDAGKPVWMKPYYNQNNNILMISYVVPMYFGETFIGVVGMDFDYKVLTDRVNEIKVYDNGFAHLEMDGVPIQNNGVGSDASADNHSGKYLRATKDLVNGMTLVLSANYDDIRQIRYEIAFKILFTVLLLSVFFTVVVIIIVRKIVGPLKKLTEASVKLSNGDYDVEIAQSNTNEIKILSMAFENMAMCLREREELLQLSATRDSLTGLRNTTSYQAWIAEFEKKIESQKVDFGVVMLDINELKETNDAYGHDAGNKLIATAAKVISDTFKRSPVFRIGGDEFLVILQNRDLNDCEKLFAQFDLTCANTHIEEEDTIPISIARGFARFDATIDSHFIDVFKRADDAMYQNKSTTKTVSV